MAYFDMPLEKLLNYLPERSEEKDFDEFWRETLEESRIYPLNPVFEKADYFLKSVEVYDVTYSGYKGQRIKGWLLVPTQRDFEKLPCVIRYVGYGGGRGFPYDWLVHCCAGYAYFVMDTRGQGTGRTKGDTPDYCEEPINPQFPGFMTRGILDPKEYYYRRVFVDAVRAVEVVEGFPLVDPDKIVVSGTSQGGGIALAVAGLSSKIKALLCNVPFLCHYKRAIEITDNQPYFELTQFLRTHRDKVDTVFRTLSYFDGVNFAARAKVPALFSVGLMDKTCPPSTVFAAYNHYTGPKRIKIYPYNDHEGGESFHTYEELKFLNEILA